MVRVEMLKCDECGVMKEITVFSRRPDAIDKPQGWYIVIAAEQVDMLHFCSLRCLKTWAHMASRELEPKIEAAPIAETPLAPHAMRYG